MDLTLADLMLIADGLKKVRDEARKSFIFISGAQGADQQAIRNLKFQISEIEDLQARIEQAIKA